jgi:uncharacterized protein YggE
MKKLFFAIAFVAISLGLASAQEKNEALIDINGSAKVKVIPDRAEIEITLRESDLKGKYTLKAWEDKLALALVNAGVDAKKQLSLYRQYVSPAKRKTINQYKTFKLEVYSPEEAQNVMDELVQNEISTGRLTKVWLADRDAVADSLKVEAIRKAKHDATVLAEAIGQSVGSAIRINYYPSRPAVVYRNVMLKSSGAETMAIAEDSAPVLPQINFEEIEIEENVTVQFVLNPVKE